MSKPTYKHLWAIILAGGAGTRLKPLTRTLTGDDRHEQFCALFGERTLLEQTQRRVAPLFNPTQTLTVVTRTHEPFYQKQMNNWSSSHLLGQPQNIGTAPAILLSLLRVAQLSPQAVVAFFASDHHFSNDAIFMSHVELAVEFVETNASLIMLLGIRPDSSEVQYGWIEPGVSTNFSKEVLEQRPGALSVLKVNGVRWTDLCEPQRVVSALQSNQFYHWTAGLSSPPT